MIYIVITILTFLIDVFIKQKYISNYELGYCNEILGGRLIIRRSHNKGAFMNFLQNKPKLLKIITGIAFILLLLIYVFALGQKGRRLLKTGIALVAGGAIGNAFDRIKQGYVIDYFSFRFLKKVVFNMSDMFIFMGLLLVLTDELVSK